MLHSYSKASINFIYLLMLINVYYYYQPQPHGFFHQLFIINYDELLSTLKLVISLFLKQTTC